jgi:hypothetical protein
MRDRSRRDASDRADAAQDDDLPGVIDTLGLGYAALVGRPLAVLPILLLELALVFSPRVRLAPVSQGVADRLRHDGDETGIASAIERMAEMNVVEFASLRMPLVRTPVLSPALSDANVQSSGWYASFSALPGGVVALIAAIAFVLGVIVNVVYRSMLAARVRRETVALVPSVRLLVQRSVKLIGWAAILTGLAVLVAMPVIVITVLAAIFGYPGSQLLWVLLFIPAAWAFVHFYFSLHALFVDDSGPYEALRASYRVVQRHFWQSMRFIMTTLLISTGLTFALQAMAASLVGIMLAISINAFVVSGIIVAAMLFYRDRARRLGIPSFVPER